MRVNLKFRAEGCHLTDTDWHLHTQKKECTEEMRDRAEGWLVNDLSTKSCRSRKHLCFFLYLQSYTSI